MGSGKKWCSARLCFGTNTFVLFINAMPSMITNTCRIFTDDANIFCNVLDSSLQDDIDGLALW